MSKLLFNKIWKQINLKCTFFYTEIWKSVSKCIQAKEYYIWQNSITLLFFIIIILPHLSFISEMQINYYSVLNLILLLVQ